MTGYEPFTEEKAISYVQEQQLFGLNEKLTAEEIGDGNLNLVFRIKSDSGRSIIVKQALPYAKVVGDSWPLTLDRARIESEALKKQHELAPELTPKVHLTNNDLALTVMDDLSHLQILRKGLIQQKVYPNLAKDVGAFLAKTLFLTSDFGMNQKDKKVLSGRFINPELCKITEDLVFTDPFFDHDTNNFPEQLRPFIEDVIWNNQQLKLEVAKLKYSFLTNGQALLHGDLHTGSIFASETETKIIDPEFAFYGPMGFDIGAFIANILLNYLSQHSHIKVDSERNEYQHYLLNVINETWTVFSNQFGMLWKESKVDPYLQVEGYEKVVLNNIFQDTLGFAGCKIIRRLMGLARVEDIESIKSEEEKLELKKKGLQLGKAILLQRTNISSMPKLFEVVKSYD